MSTDQILGREQIRSLLTEVGAILHERRVEATVYVLGGAAMALEFDSRRITHDVDVAFRGELDFSPRLKPGDSMLRLPVFRVERQVLCRRRMQG